MNNSNNPEIKVTPNSSKRTFTIRKYWKDGTISKYRTLPMSKDEFESSQNDTVNDWKNFLSHSSDYYAIK
jgi:hypothetical protein